MSSKGSS